MNRYALGFFVGLIAIFVPESSYSEFQIVGGGYDISSDMYRDLNVSLGVQMVTIPRVLSVIETTPFGSSDQEGVFIVWSGGGSCGNWGHVVHNFPDGELTQEKLLGCGWWVNLEANEFAYFGYSLDENTPAGLTYSSLCGASLSRAGQVNAPTSVYKFGTSPERPFVLVDISEYLDHSEVREIFQHKFDNVRRLMNTDRIRYEKEIPFCSLLASEEASLSELITSFYSIGPLDPANRIEHE